MLETAKLSFSNHFFAQHLQKSWTTAMTNSVHADTPEIPLLESMAG